MPLSEDEQRILQEIERNFYDSDPKYARGIREKTLFRHAGRNMKLAATGCVVAFVVMIFTIEHLVLAALAFFALLACAFVFAQNARKAGKAGIQQISETLRARTAGGTSGLADTRKRLRERFRREE